MCCTNDSITSLSLGTWCFFISFASFFLFSRNLLNFPSIYFPMIHFGMYSCVSSFKMRKFSLIFSPISFLFIFAIFLSKLYTTPNASVSRNRFEIWQNLLEENYVREMCECVNTFAFENINSLSQSVHRFIIFLFSFFSRVLFFLFLSGIWYLKVC